MPDIIKLKLSFSNAYLIRGTKTVLVDTGIPGEEYKILRAAARAGIQPGDISLILHTHAHFDHAGSTAALTRMLCIPNAVHAADAAMLRAGKMNPLTPLTFEGRLLKPVVNRPFPPMIPDLLADDFDDLSTFGVDARILHTPGHTAGSISVLLPDGTAVVGDLMMGGYLGGNLCSSRPNTHYYADDLAAVRRNIRCILDRKAPVVYVGHGGPLQFEAVRQRFGKDVD